jgi:hypothetical protein
VRSDNEQIELLFLDFPLRVVDYLNQACYSAQFNIPLSTRS